MSWTQHFLIEGAYLGTASRTYSTQSKDAAPPDGHAFFCPHCSTLWAVCAIEGRPSFPLVRNCRKHSFTSPLGPGGSVWLSWDQEFVEALPIAVLRRELELHADWHERRTADLMEAI